MNVHQSKATKYFDMKNIGLSYLLLFIVPITYSCNNSGKDSKSYTNQKTSSQNGGQSTKNSDRSNDQPDIVGARVSVTERTGIKYEGTITDVQDDRYKIRYDDDAEMWLSANQFTVIPYNTTESRAANNYQQEQRPQTNTQETSSSLYIGEYASYGTGGRQLIGLAFILLPDGRYYDLDKTRGGSYVYDAGQATISFHDGFMDGQVGKDVGPEGFHLGTTVTCSPWK